MFTGQVAPYSSAAPGSDREHFEYATSEILPSVSAQGSSHDDALAKECHAARPLGRG